jgi:hypothetical protein
MDASRVEEITNWTSSVCTFQSYGAQHDDRKAMLQNMPARHQRFFQELQFVHEIPGYIFVHSGLSTRYPIETQLWHLRTRNCSHTRPKQLVDHPAHPESMHGQLMDANVCVVSGHHGVVNFSPNRIILDNIGASPERELQCLVLPEFLLMDDTGNEWLVAPEKVFPDIFGADAVAKDMATLHV